MHLIPNRILKNVKDILALSITYTFNASIKVKLFQLTSKWLVLPLFSKEVIQKILEITGLSLPSIDCENIREITV